MTDLLYRFEETGVGCKAHSLPPCLCDVKPLAGGVPIVAVYLPGALPGDAVDGNSFTRWGSYAIGAFEALKTVNMSLMDEALSIWEGKAHPMNKSHLAAQRSRAVSLSLKAGLTIEQTARWLSTTPLEVMDQLWPRKAHAKILTLEPMIRSGSMNSKQIAAATGYRPQTIVALASRWGVKLPHAGIRHGPEVRAKARRMVRSGVSRREAARRLGLSESRVLTWCKDLPPNKRGRKKK